MAFGADPLDTNSIMGKSQSILERDNPSSINSREKPIRIGEGPQRPDELSRPDSWSLHYDRTDQAPYACSKDDNKMITATSLLTLPASNASHDLAFFLRTTGPTAPHRRPSKIGQPTRLVATPKHAFRLFKRKYRWPNASIMKTHDEYI